MEELVKIFGKYFPKEFYNFEFREKEIYLKDEEISLNFEENKINIIKIKSDGKSKVTLNIPRNKTFLIYIPIKLSENSNLAMNISGEISNEVYLAIDINGSKHSEMKIIEKTLVFGKYTNILKLFVPKGSKNLNVELNQYFLIFGDGKIVNLPILKIEEKNCVVKHSSKKIKLTEDQIFYLESKNISKEKIINLLEKSFLKT
ncbi:MAG: SufD family Fe-S cluster assembly protein [Nanopusillaceae archaeon]